MPFPNLPPCCLGIYQISVNFFFFLSFPWLPWETELCRRKHSIWVDTELGCSPSWVTLCFLIVKWSYTPLWIVTASIRDCMCNWLAQSLAHDRYSTVNYNYCYMVHIKPWLSPGVILAPRGHLAMTFFVVTTGWGCDCLLVSRGQAGC